MQLIPQRYYSKRMIDCKIFGLWEKYKMGLLLFNLNGQHIRIILYKLPLWMKCIFIKYIYFYPRCSFLYIFRKDMFPFSIFKGWLLARCCRLLARLSPLQGGNLFQCHKHSFHCLIQIQSQIMIFSEPISDSCLCLLIVGRPAKNLTYSLYCIKS